MEGGTDPRGRQAKRTIRDAELSTCSREKLGKTSGVMVVGAWGARVEIARMLERGVPSTKILEMIREGEEGEVPLNTTDTLEPMISPSRLQEGEPMVSRRRILENLRLTPQKGALRARSAERKTKKEKLKEKERERERQQGEPARAHVLWMARSGAL